MKPGLQREDMNYMLRVSKNVVTKVAAEDTGYRVHKGKKGGYQNKEESI